MRECQAGQDRPDVWTHTLDALERSTRGGRLPGNAFVGDSDARRILRWALLLHDISKPETLTIREDGRPAFHGHEVLGARRAATLLDRLRLPRQARRRVCRLILFHLRPGHLADAGPTPRGLHRLVREASNDLPLLTVHAGCDALASGSPDAERRWSRMYRVLSRLIEIWRVREPPSQPGLLTGDDVMRVLKIEPGPRVGRLLGQILERREEGLLRTREDALNWLTQAD